MKKLIYILTFLLSGMVFGQDTVYVKKNKYVLDKTERDSIFSSVYLQEKTQQLLANYEKGIDKDIFLPENHFNFLSVLNSSLVHYKMKRKFLIDRIQHDEKTITTKKRNVQTYSDRLTMSKSTNHRQSVMIEQPYYSKEETLTQFMNNVNISEYVDFSYSHFVFIKVDYSKGHTIQSIRFAEFYSSVYGIQYRFIPTKKTIREIKKLRIKEIDYMPNYVTFSPMHATTERIGQLVIYYE